MIKHPKDPRFSYKIYRGIPEEGQSSERLTMIKTTGAIPSIEDTVDAALFLRDQQIAKKHEMVTEHDLGHSMATDIPVNTGYYSFIVTEDMTRDDAIETARQAEWAYKQRSAHTPRVA